MIKKKISYKIFVKTWQYIFISIFFGYSIILSTGCVTIYNPATGKNELILIDTNSEVALGKMIVNQIKGEYKISKDAILKNRLEIIGQRLAKVCDRQDLTYHFDIIEDKEINAFATPGGYIFVNSGLMDKADENELAGVLGHEIGHIAARHSIKKLQASLGYQIIMSLVFGKSGPTDLTKATNIVFDLVSLGYSREDERLADRLAVKYAYKGGYQPEAMVRFLYKLKEEQDKQGPQLKIVFLSSHPPIEERIKNIQGEILKLEGKSEKGKITPDPPKNNSTLNKTNFISNELTNYKFSCSHGRKICPVCKKNYPQGYNFCPSDGKVLICSNN